MAKLSSKWLIWLGSGLSWSGLLHASEIGSQATLLLEGDRCSVASVPLVRARSGFEAWLRGSGRHLDPAQAVTLLRDSDRKQIRESSLLLSQEGIQEAVRVAFQASPLGKPLTLSVVQINCHAPKISVTGTTIPELSLELACDTEYKTPFKTACVVSETQTCTSIRVKLSPVVTPASQVVVRWKLEDLNITLPSLQGLLENKVDALSSDIDRFAEQATTLAKNGASVQDLMQQLTHVVDAKFGEANGVIAKLQENVTSLRDLLPLISEMSTDADQFSKLIHDLLPAQVQDHPTAVVAMHALARQLPMIQKQIPEWTRQLTSAETQLTKLVDLVAKARAGTAQEELNLIQTQLAQASDLAVAIAGVRDEIKEAVVLLPQLGQQQDEKLKSTWAQLKLTLIQTIQTQLPQEFQLAQMASIQKNLEVSELGVLEFSGELMQPVVENWENQVALRIPIQHRALRMVLP